MDLSEFVFINYSVHDEMIAVLIVVRPFNKFWSSVESPDSGDFVGKEGRMAAITINVAPGIGEGYLNVK